MTTDEIAAIIHQSEAVERSVKAGHLPLVHDVTTLSDGVGRLALAIAEEKRRANEAEAMLRTIAQHTHVVGNGVAGGSIAADLLATVRR